MRRRESCSCHLTKLTPELECHDLSELKPNTYAITYCVGFGSREISFYYVLCRFCFVCGGSIILWLYPSKNRLVEREIRDSTWFVSHLGSSFPNVPISFHGSKQDRLKIGLRGFS